MRCAVLFLLAVLNLAPSARSAPAYTGEPGPWAVSTVKATWHDARRDRDVPVKIYFPQALAKHPAERFPVIIFSHGLGGSREGYGYLGEHWASCGYISVHVQHLGSDTDSLRGPRPLQNFRKVLADPTAAINRPLDISFGRSEHVRS